MLRPFFLLLVLFASPLFASDLVRVVPKTLSAMMLFEKSGFERGSSPGNYLIPRKFVQQVPSHVHMSEFDFEHFAADVRSPSEDYHSNAQIAEELAQIAAAHPESARVVDIGTSENGQLLRALHIEHTNPDIPAVSPRPLVRLIGNIHGDEVVSRTTLLLFAYHLFEVADINKDVRELLAKVTIEIMPTMNPDGFDAGTRENANGVDMNRAFPDHFDGWNQTAVAKEVRAMMEWNTNSPPTLLANFHGGSVVCNYPFDGNAEHVSRHYSSAPDDMLLRETCLSYADYNPSMSSSFAFRGGIVNGAYWYVLYGGLQDWVYRTFGVPSVTVEMSTMKWPSRWLIETKYWPENVGSLVLFSKNVLQGVYGHVTDANTGAPVEASFELEATVPGLPFHTRGGSFGRMLQTGSNLIRVSAPGYAAREYHVEIEKGKSFILNIELTKTA